MNYYNEFDPGAAAWLRELIAHDLIPAGHVDTRSIADVSPSDLRGYAQCHFFAGIGGWALALRLAGWTDDQPVWTGSCPCQPFSAAGKQQGIADERHLWPEFRRLISECRPPVVFGEQVASRLGREWLAGVRADLEGVGYEVGAADLCASGVGAPHIRQRLYWGGFRVAHDRSGGREVALLDAGGGPASNGFRETGELGVHGESGRLADVQQPGLEGLAGDVDDGCQPGRDGAQAAGSVASGGGVGGVGDPEGAGGGSFWEAGRHGARWSDGTGGNGESGGVGDSDRTGREALRGERVGEGTGSPESADSGSHGDFWSRYDLIPCRDGKVRRVESGTFPLAHGVPGRVGLLRGYGNAIVPQVAATFVKAFFGQ